MGKEHENEHDLAARVDAAKTDNRAADLLIEDYLPFIRAETAKFLQRPVADGQDDELSIALIAFHEAILGYSSGRGAFLAYASMLIRSRLIDYRRKEARHSHVLSLDVPEGEDGVPRGDLVADERDHAEELVLRQATRAEIEELTEQMEDFQGSLADVADNCPRQERTLTACRRAMQYAKEDPALLEEFLKTKKLPMAKLAEGSGVERKTLERHRKYLVALLLIQTNGFEILRGHLMQVMKGGNGR